MTEHGFLGTFIVLSSNDTAEVRGEEPADRQLEDRQVLSEDADGVKREYLATFMYTSSRS